MTEPSFCLIELTKIVNEKGVLTVGESNKDIPFLVKRLFCISKVDSSVVRGGHANTNSRLYVFATSGSCEIEVDDGTHKESIILSRIEQGLFINCMVWKIMKNFSPDCVLVVLSDHFYDEGEYIYDYREFLDALRVKNLEGSDAR